MNTQAFMKGIHSLALPTAIREKVELIAAQLSEDERSTLYSELVKEATTYEASALKEDEILKNQEEMLGKAEHHVRSAEHSLEEEHDVHSSQNLFQSIEQKINNS